MFRLISVPVSIGLLLLAGEAPAQNATNVQCTGCVGADDLAANSVTTNKIADGGVRSPDLGSNSVTSGKIKDGDVKFVDLSPGVQADLREPRWRVLRAVGDDFVDVPDMVFSELVPNLAEQRLSIVMVKLTNDHYAGFDWYPAVIAANGNIAFGYQGTPYNHTILAYPANSNCSGPPVKLVLRSAAGPMTPNNFPEVPFRGYTAYDFRSGDIYYFSSGTSGDGIVNYDLLEYGNDKGFFPSNALACSVNVNLTTRPDLFDGSNSFFLDPVLIGNMPPTGENFLVGFR